MGEVVIDYPDFFRINLGQKIAGFARPTIPIVSPAWSDDIVQHDQVDLIRRRDSEFVHASLEGETWKSPGVFFAVGALFTQTCDANAAGVFSDHSCTRIVPGIFMQPQYDHSLPAKLLGAV